MKLTRTGAVFSRTTMVLFLCRNKSSRIGTELFGEFLYNKRKILEPRTTGGGSLGEHNPPGCPPPSAPRGWARPPPSWVPRDSPPVTLHSSIFYIFQKNSPLIFIAFRELLFLHKNNTTVVLLKTVSARVRSIQILPKPFRIVVNMP